MKGTIKKIASQKGGFLNFLRPLMTDCLPSMKSVFTPLAKSVLLLLGLISAASATVAVVQKKLFGSGMTHQ